MGDKILADPCRAFTCNTAIYPTAFPPRPLPEPSADRRQALVECSPLALVHTVPPGETHPPCTGRPGDPRALPGIEFHTVMARAETGTSVNANSEAALALRWE